MMLGVLAVRRANKVRRTRFKRGDDDLFRCQHCGEPEWEHEWICDGCGDVLPIAHSGLRGDAMLPSLHAAHGSARLYCRSRFTVTVGRRPARK
jgi:hypothetical protein